MSVLAKLKIRKRGRRGRPKEAHGDYMVWTEWQLVDGRTVIGRYDFEEQAIAAMTALLAVHKP